MNRSQFTPLVTGAAAALALTALTAMPSFAQVWYPSGNAGHGYLPDTYSELPGDSGSTIGTADNVTAHPDVQYLDGSLTGLADVYKLSIGTVGYSTYFTATTIAPPSQAGTEVGDPQLFLFDVNGKALDMNYNGQNSSISETLTGGTYYLAIAEFNYAPVNSSNQLLFATPGGHSSNIIGANSDTGGETLSTWTKVSGDSADGAYQIKLSVVPEPGMVVTGLAMIGTTGLGLVRGRARSKKSRGTAAAAA